MTGTPDRGSFERKRLALVWGTNFALGRYTRAVALPRPAIPPTIYGRFTASWHRRFTAKIRAPETGPLPPVSVPQA